MAYIVVTIAGKEPQHTELRGRVTLGRSPKCTVWVNDPSLSREHCRIEQEGKSWYVTDLKSRNGTFIGGNKIERSLLGDKDIVKIGDARVEFRDGIKRPPRAADPAQDHLVRLMMSELQAKKAPAAPDQSTPRPMPKAMPRARTKSGVASAKATDSSHGSADERWDHGSNSLAFQRPRATPIVRPKKPREDQEKPNIE